MNLHQEHHFESEICAHLAANGWFYEEGDAAKYDRTNGLFLPDLLAWVEETQPASFAKLSAIHGSAAVTGQIDVHNSAALSGEPSSLELETLPSNPASLFGKLDTLSTKPGDGPANFLRGRRA